MAYRQGFLWYARSGCVGLEVVTWMSNSAGLESLSVVVCPVRKKRRETSSSRPAVPYHLNVVLTSGGNGCLVRGIYLSTDVKCLWLPYRFLGYVSNHRFNEFSESQLGSAFFFEYQANSLWLFVARFGSVHLLIRNGVGGGFYYFGAYSCVLL